MKQQPPSHCSSSHLNLLSCIALKPCHLTKCNLRGHASNIYPYLFTEVLSKKNQENEWTIAARMWQNVKQPTKTIFRCENIAL